MNQPLVAMFDLVKKRAETMELMRTDARTALSELEKVRSEQKEQLESILSGTKQKIENGILRSEFQTIGSLYNAASAGHH